jgi:hypothetical protein
VIGEPGKGHRIKFSVVREDEQTVTIRQEELDRIIEFVNDRAWYTAKASYAEWIAKQCHRISGEHPWSAEAETLQMVAGFATRDAAHYREKATDVDVEQELRWTDLDELAERLTQN